MASALSTFQSFKFTAKSHISAKLMAKLKLSTMIHSLQLCRSKHHSTFPGNPVPASYGLSPANLPPPPPSTPVQILRSPCHVSSSSNNVSIGCGCRSGSCVQFLFSFSGREISPEKSFDSRSRRTSHSKSRSSSSLKINRTRKELKSDALSGISSSDWFGDEEDSREIKTLVSSFSSTDSSPELSSTTTQSEKRSTKRGDPKTRSTRNYRSPENELSGEFVGAAVAIEEAEGEKLKESFAVAKKSKDPYRDFKRSMTEMIVEKEMFEAEELEQLLQCFLSLNSRSYHRVIVEAFSEIWEVLFCDMNLPLSLAD